MSSENERIKVIIASPPDYEELVAEIYLNDQFIGLLNKEKGEQNLELEIADTFAVGSMTRTRKVSLNCFLEAVEYARKRLVGECR